MDEDLLDSCTEFDWDDGNLGKNWDLHRVAFWESEEVFFNEPLLVRSDTGHSSREVRYLALGQTDAGRLLFLSFTVRGPFLRVISARDMTRREVRAYGQAKE
ncbi:MAG: BrnT family toxin [Acidobacteria bacterium]|nr:BrnT family toxin [Acidobacteriota bacterium]